MRTIVKTVVILIIFSSFVSIRSTFAVISDNGNPDTMTEDSGRNEGVSDDRIREVRKLIDQSIKKKQAEAILEIYKLFSSSPGTDQNNGNPSTLTPTTSSTQVTPMSTSPTPDSTSSQFPPNQSFTALTDLYTSIGTKLRVPPCVLVAVSKIEYPTAWNYTSGQIVQYSSPNQQIPNCPWNSCSAKGHMQMTVGVDELGSARCERCCWTNSAGVKSCQNQCPNAWGNSGSADSFGNTVKKFESGSWTPNACNLKDATYAAGAKLKNNSQTTVSDINWTKESIDKASVRYYGNCTVKYSRLGNRTYCEYVNYICSLK